MNEKDHKLDEGVTDEATQPDTGAGSRGPSTGVTGRDDAGEHDVSTGAAAERVNRGDREGSSSGTP